MSDANCTNKQQQPSVSEGHGAGDASEKTGTPDSGSAASHQTRQIYCESTGRGTLTVTETANRTMAFVSIQPSESGPRFSPGDVRSVLTGLGITAVIREKDIQGALQSLYEENRPLENLPAAQGLNPVAGTNGTCEVLFDRNEPFAEKQQVLLRIGDPAGGQPGRDIYGNTIPPCTGTRPRITPGENVFESEDGSEILSDAEGMITFDGTSISVRKVLEIGVSDDRMQASLSYTGQHALSAKMIRDELHACGVVSGIDNHAIDFITSTFAAGGKPVSNFPVARGTACRNGRDGTVTFSFETGTEPVYTEKDDGSIDIRETHIARSVQQGTEIATIVPHVDPVPGKDVSGKVISAPRVRKVVLKAGKNVEVSKDGLHFFAQKNGRPILEADKVSISEIFSIQGNLDLSVGNIDFDGVVEIGGDVEDGFMVKASRSIIIHGLVSACCLEAGLDIQVMGGCNGKGQSLITCGGNFEARYINEASIRCKGDVRIKNEIVNSSVTSLGRVVVKTGSIRGGTVIAKKGIECHDVGSDMGVKTVLVPGQNYELNEKCTEIDSRIIEINNEMSTIGKRIAPLTKNRELIAKLPRDQRSKLKETIDYLHTLTSDKASLNQTKSGLIDESLRDAVPEVVVYHFVYQGTLLKIGASRREIGSQIEGPLRLYEEDERVTVEPYPGAGK